LLITLPKYQKINAGSNVLACEAEKPSFCRISLRIKENWGILFVCAAQGVYSCYKLVYERQAKNYKQPAAFTTGLLNPVISLLFLKAKLSNLRAIKFRLAAQLYK
jgi:hypothetical protein